MSFKLQDNQQLVELIEANAPYWAAEAEIIRTYWSWPGRDSKSDQKWILHQIYKEYWDGVFHYTSLFKNVSMATPDQNQLQELKRLAETLAEEVEHYSLFTNLFLKLHESSVALNPLDLRREGSWPENDELIMLRRSQIDQSPILGRRASMFTEGGYVALFREGYNMPIKTDIDAAISEACGCILDEEFTHMLHGLIDMCDDRLPLADLQIVKDFSVDQMKKRLLMRYMQFSKPVSSQRFSEMLAGQADPILFDYDSANTILYGQLHS